MIVGFQVNFVVDFFNAADSRSKVEAAAMASWKPLMSFGSIMQDKDLLR